MILPLLIAMTLGNPVRVNPDRPVTMVRMPGNTDPNGLAKPHGFANEAIDADEFKDQYDKPVDKHGASEAPPVMAPPPAMAPVMTPRPPAMVPR